MVCSAQAAALRQQVHSESHSELDYSDLDSGANLLASHHFHRRSEVR